MHKNNKQEMRNVNHFFVHKVRKTDTINLHTFNSFWDIKALNLTKLSLSSFFISLNTYASPNSSLISTTTPLSCSHALSTHNMGINMYGACYLNKHSINPVMTSSFQPYKMDTNMFDAWHLNICHNKEKWLGMHLLDV